MTILEIFPPFIYSIRFSDDENDMDEYSKCMIQWQDTDQLESFFTKNQLALDPVIWGEASDPEIAAVMAFDEAIDIESSFQEMAENTRKGNKPDLDSMFHPLGGEYAYEWKLLPVKAYGRNRPSYFRIYAIKLQANCYLITGGGIKIVGKMEESPELRAELSKIEKVRSFLKENGIETNEDF